MMFPRQDHHPRSRSISVPRPTVRYNTSPVDPGSVRGAGRERIMSASVIKDSTQRFMAEPSAARSAPAVTASLVNGRARLSAGPFNWDADLPPAVGGENSAPSPTAYLLGALALGHADLDAQDSGRQASFDGVEDGPQAPGHHRHSVRPTQMLPGQRRT